MSRSPQATPRGFPARVRGAAIRLRPVAALLLSTTPVLMLGLGGCALTSPGIHHSGDVASLGDGKDSEEPGRHAPEVRAITPELLLEQRRRAGGNAFNPGRYPPRRELSEGHRYLVGAGDVLSVIVWNHPELSNPMGTTRGMEGIGRLVREDGTIFFPFAGLVNAAGRSTEAIRNDLTARLRPYIEEPQVEVRVVEFRSQKVYVTGEVSRPGVIYLDDRPLTILEALSRAEGLTDVADRRLVRLTRDGEQRDVDLSWLYSTGDRDEVLRDGDVIHVPEDDFNKVFVMGEVGSQTSVPMPNGRLSLAEAISAAEGLNLGTADTRRIVVIRGDPVHDEHGELQAVRPVLFELDGREASALLLAEGFDLEPRDIVFIPATTFARWNRVIDQVLPTIQALWMTDRLIRD